MSVNSVCCSAEPWGSELQPSHCCLCLLCILSLHILQTAKVPHSQRLLQKFAQLRLSALAHLESRRTGAAHVILLTALPLPRSCTAGELFGYQSRASPAALCRADTAICKEFTFQGMPVPVYLKITTSQQDRMQSALLNAWVHSYNCIIQCCELSLLRQCVLDIDCTEGQLVLEKQTGCFA